MPHSEYVSGSACIFQGTEDFIVHYLEEIGLDTPFPMAFGPFEAGSSDVEPGIVPSETIVLRYESVQAMATAGSQSRLNGGMHFEESVPAARALCADIGTIVSEGTTALYKND